MPDNIKKCGIDSSMCKKGTGGKDCWNSTRPTLDICAKCDCLTCSRSICPPHNLEMKRQHGDRCEDCGE